MLSAVSVENDRFEGLRDYIIGNKRPPPQVPGASSRPRLEAKPGSEVPGPRGKIPTSSQRPGKQTNQHIVYARVVFSDFHTSAASPSDIFPGDVVLVHKSKNALGHDTNRPSKVASFRQINAILEGKTTGTLLSSEYTTGMLKARGMVLRGLKETRDRLVEEDDYIDKRKSSMPPNTNIKLSKDEFEDEVSALQIEINKLENNDPDSTFIPCYDWMAVPFLSDWLPDGVLLSRDDDEYNADYFHAGGGDSGTVMNVVIQGPTFARNSSTNNADTTPHAFAQLFDPEPRICDHVYLVLICEKVNDDAGNFKAYSFRFKPTSSRIIEELGRKNSSGDLVWASKADTGYPNMHCLTHTEATNIAAAWRIGTVMDNRASTMSEAKITANVNIEYVPAYTLALKCGMHVGSAYAPWSLKKGEIVA